MQVILETDRLKLRELGAGDLDFVAALVGHPEVMAFWPKTYSREEAVDWIRRQHERYARDGYGYWLAVAKDSGQAVGLVGLLRQDFDGRSEVGIGYIIHRPFWRRGYAMEAASASRDYAFTRLARQRIVVLVRPENTRSQIVARKLGGVAERETLFADLIHTVFVISRPSAGATL